MKSVSDSFFEDDTQQSTIYLEKMIGYRFSVSPDHSFRAYEDFTMPDGEVVRLQHYVFGYITEGRIDDKQKVATMAKRLWDDLKLSWPPGAFLMWRRRPEIAEENDRDTGWLERGDRGPRDDSPDNWRVWISLRIGSFVPPHPIVLSLNPAGEKFHHLQLAHDKDIAAIVAE